MIADYFLKKDLIFIVFDGVEIVLEYNGNVGTHKYSINFQIIFLK